MNQEPIASRSELTTDLLQTVVGQNNDAITIKDAGGKYILVNAAAACLLGIRAEEALGKTDAELLPRKLADKIMQVDARIMKTGEGRTIHETVNVKEKERLFESTKMPYGESNGRVAGVISVLRDITERRQIEERLRVSEEKFAKAFRSSPDPIAISTLEDGKIVDVNEGFTNVTGFSRDETLGKTTVELGLISPADRDRFVRTLKTESRVQNMVVEARLKSGRIRQTQISSEIVQIEGRPHLVTVVRDTTERRHIEDILDNVATRFASVYGTEFFDQVCAHICQVMETEYAFVGKLMPGKHRVRVVGGADRDQALEPFEYDLAGTPCVEVIGKQACVYEEARELFPEDRLLEELNIEGYAGIPLYARSGEPLGIFVTMSTRPITDKELAVAMMTAYSERVSAEIERAEAEAAVRESEQRYRVFVERSIAGIFHFELHPRMPLDLPVDEQVEWIFHNSRLAECNDTFARDRGFSSRDEMIGLSLRKTWGEDDKPAVKTVRDFIVQGYRLDRYEAHAHIRTGEYKWFLNTGFGAIENDCLTQYWGTQIDVTERKRGERERELLLHSLGERIKELRCLYEIAETEQLPDISIEDTFSKIVELIPPSWQYPDITCARISIDDLELKTPDFKETRWRQSTDIVVEGDVRGEVDVCYLKKRPEIDEGPFLKEERDLVEAIAERSGRIIERKQALERRQEFEKALHQKDRDIRRAYADVFNAVTGGKLLMLTSDEMSAAQGAPQENPFLVPSFERLADSRDFLRRTLEMCGLSEDKLTSMVLASGEAITNGVKHAGSCEVQVFSLNGVVQIMVSDDGPGIDFSDLPKATLLPGFSTKKSLGMGYAVILDVCDRVLLTTGSHGTTLVLESGEEPEDALDDILARGLFNEEAA